MSVNCSAFLVEWSRFTTRLAETGDADEAIGGVPRELLHSDSVLAQFDFLDCFDASRRTWAGPSRVAFQEFFDHLFWSWRGERFQIVDLEEPDVFGIDSAWNPATVQRLASVTRDIDFEAFRNTFRPGKLAAYWTADEFAEYGRSWLDLVQRGAADGRGLVILVYS
jgi:hypothetical protein